MSDAVNETESPPESASESIEAVRKRVPAHGRGLLFSGGVPGNAGGPGAPSSALRARLRGSLLARVAVLESIADDPAGLSSDRIRAIDVLARYGLGAATELSVESVRERLALTLDVLQTELPGDQARHVIALIEPIWS